MIFLLNIAKKINDNKVYGKKIETNYNIKYFLINNENWPSFKLQRNSLE